MGSHSFEKHASEKRCREACAELSNRLRAGEEFHAEDIFAVAPGLAEHFEYALEIIYTEFVTEEELGRVKPRAEWFARFPRFRDRLERLFQIHQNLGAPTPHHNSPITMTALTGGAEAPPRRVGRYEIVREVGRGGMGVVYLARQPQLDRLVALKMILAGGHADPHQMRRFRAEAQIVARLQHAHIVQIYEVDECDGCPFLALEYVAGGSLDKYLAGKPLPPLQAAELLETLAGAVHHAHLQGIVHRDLKPANILLQSVAGRQQSGVGSEAIIGNSGPAALSPNEYRLALTDYFPKITDFGLARQLDGALGLTNTGAVVGTPSYMAPEQAAGHAQRIGPAADVYSLGAILYEALTGRPPFQAESALAILEQVREREPVSIWRLQPNVPRDLQTICLKCLEKEPRRRYLTAAELAADLRRFLNKEPILARPSTLLDRGAKWTRRHPAIAGLTSAVLGVALAGIAGIVWQWRRAESAATVARTERDTALIERANAEDSYHRAERVIDEMTTVGKELVGQPGMHKTAQRLLEKSLGFYQEFLAKKSDDQAIRLQTTRASYLVADINRTFERWGLAEPAIRQGIALIEELAAEFPDNPIYLQEQARCHALHADILRYLLKTEESATAYLQSRACWQKLAARGSNQLQSKYFEANALLNWCSLYSAPPKDLEKAFVEAIRLEDELCAAAPKNRMYMAESGLGHDDYGMFLLAQGRRDRARSECEQALQIRRNLYELAPQSVSARQYLARSLTNLGEIYAQDGEREKAIDSIEKSAQLLATLVKEFPDIPAHRRQLTFSLVNQVALLDQSGREAERESLARQIVMHQEKLARDVPTDPGYAIAHATHLINLAILLGTSSGQPEAEGLVRQATNLRAKIAAAFPESSSYESEAVNYALALARWHGQCLHFPEAAEAHRVCVELLPKSAAACNNRALFLLACPDPKVRDLPLALTMAKKANALSPQEASYWNSLGTLHFRLGDFKDAIEALQRAVRLRPEGMARDWLFLAMAYWRLGDKTEAHAYLTKSQEWLARQKSRDPELTSILAEAEAMIRKN